MFEHCSIVNGGKVILSNRYLDHYLVCLRIFSIPMDLFSMIKVVHYQFLGLSNSNLYLMPLLLQIFLLQLGDTILALVGFLCMPLSGFLGAPKQYHGLVLKNWVMGHMNCNLLFQIEIVGSWERGKPIISYAQRTSLKSRHYLYSSNKATCYNQPTSLSIESKQKIET